MADISAIFFILLIMGIAFPAMLTAWWLLFPSLVARSQIRVEKTLTRTFWLGLVIIIALTIPIVILLALPIRSCQIHRLDSACRLACSFLHRVCGHCRAPCQPA